MTGQASGPSAPAAGWHGKLPTVGDFATRRLDGDFTRIWDQWISYGLNRLRQGNERWLDAYLTSPTWRFLLTPGFLPAPLHGQTWVGVVMPSVDRVGRYYPLTLAYPLQHGPHSAREQAALWSWLHRLEDLAVDALQEDWSIEAMERELLRLGVPRLDAAADQALGGAHPSERFFAACAASAPQCVWYSQSDVSAPRSFSSGAADESIVQLWMTGAP